MSYKEPLTLRERRAEAKAEKLSNLDDVRESSWACTVTYKAFGLNVLEPNAWAVRDLQVFLPLIRRWTLHKMIKCPGTDIVAFETQPSIIAQLANGTEIELHNINDVDTIADRLTFERGLVLRRLTTKQEAAKDVQAGLHVIDNLLTWLSARIIANELEHEERKISPQQAKLIRELRRRR